MFNLNLTILEGRLTRDAEYKESQKGGTTLVKFSIASNGYGSKLKENEAGVSFFDIIANSEVAQAEMQKLKKGVGIRVIGSLSQWRWQDDSGNKHSKICIFAKNIDYIFRNGKPKFN